MKITDRYFTVLKGRITWFDTYDWGFEQVYRCLARVSQPRGDLDTNAHFFVRNEKKWHVADAVLRFNEYNMPNLQAYMLSLFFIFLSFKAFLWYFSFCRSLQYPLPSPFSPSRFAFARNLREQNAFKTFLKKHRST